MTTDINQDELSPSIAVGNNALVTKLIKPLEIISAMLLTVIVVMLLVGVVSRYVFSIPIIWIDEVVSISFLWLAMLGSAIAVSYTHLTLPTNREV